jgi:hypothetical protein
MFKWTSLFKKVALGALVLVLGVSAFPLSLASAAGLSETDNPPASQPDNSRLETAWARELKVYQRQDELLSKADEFTSRIQALIDKANGKGLDTAAIQAALNALEGVLPAVQSAHAPGAGIVSSHAGFDASGKVTDRTTALQTVKSLHEVIQNTRTAMDGTLKALHAAVKAFREAHKPSGTPTP